MQLSHLPLAYFLISTVTLAAQKPVPCNTKVGKVYCTELRNYLASNDATSVDFKTLADPTLDQAFFAAAVAPSLEDLLITAADKDSAFTQAVDAWEKTRLDVQTGSTANASSGGTDLVARTGLAALISAAYQLGSFTETTSGSTATIGINAGGLFHAINQTPDIQYNVSPKPIRWSFDNLNISVGVDITQNGNQTIPTTGAANSSTPNIASVVLPSNSGTLSSVTARYAVNAPFDPRSGKFIDAFNGAYSNNQLAIEGAGVQLNLAVEKAVLGFTTGTGPDQLMALQKIYLPKLKQDAAAKNGQALEGDFDAYVAAIVQVANQLNPSFLQDMSTVRIRLASFLSINRQIVAAASGQSPVTIEYDFNRPQNQPEVHTLKAAFAHQSGSALFTGNLAADLYGGHIDSSSSYHRFRDFQIAAQLDAPIGKLATTIATFSAAFYAQYQQDPSVLTIGASNLAPGTNITLPANAQVLLGTSGWLEVAQAKVTINTKSGIKIPFAIKWSNKTDLLDSNDVRGQFGVSYDFSSFSQLLGAKRTP